MLVYIFMFQGEKSVFVRWCRRAPFFSSV